MNLSLPRALFEASLSCEVDAAKTLSKKEADNVFSFFQQCRLFRWADAQNDCEDRAHAIGILLDKWKIPVYKGWVFSGAYLKRTPGNLVNFWNYHVAAALPVMEEGIITSYIIDPSTAPVLISLEQWADKITETACSYYLLRSNEDYIFHQAHINNDNWYKKNRQNYKWTMQGLAGINGVGQPGKAKLVFQKKKIQATEKAFKRLLNNNPF